MSCYKQQVLPLVKIEKKMMKLSKKGWDSLVKKMNHHLCSIKVEALIPNSLNGKKCLQQAKDKFRYLLTANLFIGLGL